jgi:pimeloyl-ACP methyl ester carboxylesterase
MQDVVLVGHSQAGCTLPRMVAIRPDLFRRLVFRTARRPGSSGHDRGRVTRGGSGESGVADRPPRRDSRRALPVMFCNDMNPSEREAFMAKVGGDMWPARSYSHTDWSYDHLDAVPATYVVCLRDNILPVEWQKKFAERFRCDRVVQIDAGHQAMDTRPHGVAEILRNESAVERSSRVRRGCGVRCPGPVCCRVGRVPGC